jgi:23S rRNA A2030 N6-methylase RlmJ
MHGSGMLVINPTWGLDARLDELADWFAPLGQGNVVLRNRLNKPS